MDLFHDSLLFAHVCYRLCVFDYKYPVVAVVRPQSCLRLTLAIHYLPSLPLSSLGLRPHLSHRTIELLNPCLHSYMLSSSTPRPCKALTPDDQSILRNAVIILPLPPLFCLLHQLQVAVREEYRCAITKIFDSAQAEKLLQEERIREIPKRVGQHAMEATHIIPFLLNGLYGRAITDLQIVRNVLSFSHFTHLCNRRMLLGLWICFGPGRELT